MAARAWESIVFCGGHKRLIDAAMSDHSSLNARSNLCIYTLLAV